MSVIFFDVKTGTVKGQRITPTQDEVDPATILIGIEANVEVPVSFVLCTEGGKILTKDEL